MIVNVTINNSTSRGQFADIRLSFSDRDGNLRSVPLHISFQELFDFSNDVSSVKFDLFLIASIVYGVDNLLPRDEYSIDGWARDIEVTIPINNIQHWNVVCEKLVSLLSFLTGDYWSISFVQGNFTFFENKKKRWKINIPTYNYNEIKHATLFSGGLDSLVGVIDLLEQASDNDKLLFISHYDSESAGTKSDQDKILSYLNPIPVYQNKIYHARSAVALSRIDSNGDKINCEPSLRSRSFLFISIGVYLIESLTNANTLIIPENGTISLNYPLTKSRTSTLSTRTTYPYFILKLQELLSDLGLTTQLKNPYWDKTKGELVAECLNQRILANSYLKSVSCGKRGRKQHWDTRSGTSHCGVCMPCIYRRAALHKINLDNQLYGIDLFTTPNHIYDKYDFPAVSDFLKANMSLDDIKRNLIVNGSLNISELDTYAQVVDRVRDEIRDWINSKGNDELKSLAGLI